MNSTSESAKPSDGSPPPEEVSLLDRVHTAFATLRKKDATIRKYQTEIRKHNRAWRLTRQLIRIAENAVRTQESWLMQQALDQVRKEAGVRIVPGFGKPREHLNNHRKAILEKYEAECAAARAKLGDVAAPLQPEAPAPTPDDPNRDDG